MTTDPLFIVNQYSYRCEISDEHNQVLERTESAIFSSDNLPVYIEKKVIEYSTDLKMEVTPKDCKILAAKIIELGYIRSKEDMKSGTETLEIIKCDINSETTDNVRSLLDFDDDISLIQMIEDLRRESPDSKENPRVAIFEFRVKPEVCFSKLQLEDIHLVSAGIYTEGAFPLIIEDKIIDYTRNIGHTRISQSRAKSLVQDVLRAGSMTWQTWSDKPKIERFFTIIKTCEVNKKIEIFDTSSILKDFQPVFIRELLRKKEAPGK